MLWIRLYNTQGKSILVNFGAVSVVIEDYIFLIDEVSTVRISGGDQAKIHEALRVPTYGVTEVECEGLLDLS